MFYRPAVAGIIEDRDGRILICERLDSAGGWQFPQGGIEASETREEALARELLEELCLPAGSYEVVESKGPYRYKFPAGLTKRGFRGQAHHYFLVKLLDPETLLKVNSPHPEFRAIRWIKPCEFQLVWLPLMKREVYRRVFRDFFGVKLELQDCD